MLERVAASRSDAAIKFMNKRLNAGLSRLDVAEILHVSVGTIKNWENNKTAYSFTDWEYFRLKLEQMKQDSQDDLEGLIQK